MNLVHDAVFARLPTAAAKIAIAAGNTKISYGELHERVRKLATKLVSWGLRPGERVAIVAESAPEYLITALAVWRVGGILMTVHPTYGPAEIHYVLRNGSPRIVFVDKPRREPLEAAVHTLGLQAILLTLGEDPNLEKLEPSTTLPTVDPSTVALICYTSGSTANPKPVAHTHRGLAAAIASYASTWRVSEVERTLISLPMAWVFGLISSSMTTLSSGGMVVVLPHFNPMHVIEAMERERVTFFIGVTTMYVKLVNYVQSMSKAPDLSSLRFCITGGEARNEATFEEWRRITGGCSVHDIYASSECFPTITYDPAVDARPRLGSAGKLVAGAQIRLLDEDGREASPLQGGEAYVRTPAMMACYWDEPELTRAAFTEDGWYRTLDTIRFDEDGYAYVIGRLSGMIKRGGSNVSPAEVEAVLNEHPDVVQAVVVSLPDAEYGEKVAAAVILKSGAHFDEQALRDLCAARLAPFKVPALVRRFDDLPRNSTGKIQRRDVVALMKAQAN